MRYEPSTTASKKDLLGASIQDALAFKAHREAADALRSRALEILSRTHHLALPAWEWVAPLTNPPTLRDRSNNVVAAERMPEFPEKVVAIGRVSIMEKVRLNGGVDAILEEKGGPPLAVTIHVHSSSCAGRIRDLSRCWRSLEIDLSGLLKAESPSDADIAAAVYDDVSNRSWIDYPHAIDESEFALERLSRRLQRKQLLPRTRKHVSTDTEENARLKNARHANEVDLYAMRSIYARALESLPELTSPVAVQLKLERRWVRDRMEAESLMRSIRLPSVIDAIRTFHRDAWVFGIHPVLWQARLFKRLIEPAETSTLFDRHELERELVMRLGANAVLMSLFTTQRWDAIVNGNLRELKRAPKSRYFTKDENAMIPNLIAAVSDFFDRLVASGVLCAMPPSKRYLIRVRQPMECLDALT